MKIARVTTAYPSYLRQFYTARRGLEQRSFAEQQAALNGDFFGWVDSWAHATAPLGHEMIDVILNAISLQRAWAREQRLSTATRTWLADVCVEQLKRFRPEVLWYDHTDAALLRRLRDAVPSIRLVLGWAGSAVPVTEVWRDMHLVLSCAQESVEQLTRRGVRARQLHHAFDARVLERLRPRRPLGVTFVGQILRGEGFHRKRQGLLEALCATTEVTIFSAEAGEDLVGAVRGAWRALEIRDLPSAVSAGLGLVQRARRHATLGRLVPHLRPAVYGVEMYCTIASSSITLNVHADSSPRFASNMRLFETTGVGSCLLTDARSNLPDLFDVDREVVAYGSVDECREKVRWLLDHTATRDEIARAGQARTLRSHSFAQRALELDEIIKKEMAA